MFRPARGKGRRLDPRQAHLYGHLHGLVVVPLDVNDSAAGAKLDGTNQLPQLLSGKPAKRDPILIASYDIALIDGDWKLIEPQAGEARQLYNLKDDPSEKADLAKTNPETLARLGATLDALKKDLPAAPARTPGPGSAGGGRPSAGGGARPGAAAGRPAAR